VETGGRVKVVTKSQEKAKDQVRHTRTKQVGSIDRFPHSTDIQYINYLHKALFGMIASQRNRLDHLLLKPYNEGRGTIHLAIRKEKKNFSEGGYFVLATDVPA
jgi:hypothetical protein